MMWELPPRARRIPHGLLNQLIPLGTTSACAENTPASCCFVFLLWNYLRVRGEYQWGQVTTAPE